MPYASVHYPFEMSDAFTNGHFPADFIAEGLDQTRGWFWSLTVLGNLLFEKSPFKNVLVNGMVLAEDGKKMSKRLKNYPASTRIFDEYGSDALRLYLIGSPVVKAEPLRFKEAGLREIISHILLPLWNSYRFFSEQATLYMSRFGQGLVVPPDFTSANLTNDMDRWILANCQSLVQFVEQEMAGERFFTNYNRLTKLLTKFTAYHLHTVVPRLVTTIDNLTNWYIRFNRKRLKGAVNLVERDTVNALNCLLQVLFTLVRTLAPFTPFLSEHIYCLLKPHLGHVLPQFTDSRSVHFLPFPTVQEDFFDEVVQRKIRLMQQVVQLGRMVRERKGLSLKTPLSSAVVIADAQHLADLDSVVGYIQEELNVRSVVLSSDEAKYQVRLEARVDWPTLGKKLKKRVLLIRKALPGLSQAQLRGFQQSKVLEVNGILLREGDLSIVRYIENNSNEGDDGAKWEAVFGESTMVLLDTAPRTQLQEEGMARDLISRVQRLRKKGKLVPTDVVDMQYSILSNPSLVRLDEAVADNKHLFLGALGGELVKTTPEELQAAHNCILQEDQEMGGVTLRLALLRC